MASRRHKADWLLSASPCVEPNVRYPRSRPGSVPTEINPKPSIQGEPNPPTLGLGSQAAGNSIDPELMICMLLIGYAFGIRSERRLCSEVRLNLAYRWFCGLGLDGAVPDHSTSSKNRHGRFRESDLFRLLFEDVVRSCMRAGLVGGEGFAIASVIEADASRGRKVDGQPTTWPDDGQVTRPVREYLAALDQAMEANATRNDNDDFPPGNPSAEPKVTSLTDPASAWTN
jgi:transposase